MKFPNLREYPLVGIDVEATGLEWWLHHIFGVAISVEDRDYYYDLRETPEILDWLREEAPHIQQWVAHNAKYEVHMCREAGIMLPQDRLHCTMIRAALLDEHQLAYDLDTVGVTEVGERKDQLIWQELADLFGGAPTKKAQIGNLVKAPPALTGRYAKQDARLCFKVWESQERKIIEQDLGRVYQIERDLLPVLVDIEHRGVRVNIPRAEEAMGLLTVEIDKQRTELDTLAGFPVNPNPSKSIHTLFRPSWDGSHWKAVDGTILKPTDAGKPSFDKETLQRMKHPGAAMILSTREMLRTRDTFLKGHVLGFHQDGVIHANFNQTKSENDLGTGTGRLSCNEPALQQIHKRNAKIAAIVRSCFVPDEGQDWSCHDWSQMDFRVFAHYVQDPNVLRAYQENPEYDYHQMVAEFTGLPRKPTAGIKGNAKQINLGLVFGMGPGKLASEMGLPYTIDINKYTGREYMKPGPEAEAIFAQYHNAVPGVRKFLKMASDTAKERGFVRTITGRRIRFPGGQYVHKAGGLIFQGTAADALKRKLKQVHDLLSGTDGRLLLNVHDEFDSTVPKGEAGDRIRAQITECIETFDVESTGFDFRVPIRSSCGVGPDWWAASKE